MKDIQTINQPEAKTMKTFKVFFNDGNYLTTGFNGTMQEAESYYLGHLFNLGDGEKDHMVKAIRIQEVA
jgi:hypothetical protein